MSRNLGVPYTDKQPYYFVSYNAEDEAIVSKYAAALSEFNFHIWYDNGIKIGKKWEVEIVEKMEKSQAVIMFISKNIFLKEQSYVYKEFELATKYFNKNIYVILLDKVKESDVPNRFKIWWISITSLQCIHAFDYDSPEECIRVLYENVRLQTDETATSEKSDAETLPTVENPADTDKGTYGNTAMLNFWRLARPFGILALILTMFLGTLINFIDVGVGTAELNLCLLVLGFMGAYLFFWSGGGFKGTNGFYRLLFVSLIAAIVVLASGNLLYMLFEVSRNLTFSLFNLK